MPNTAAASLPPMPWRRNASQSSRDSPLVGVSTLGGFLCTLLKVFRSLPGDGPSGFEGLELPAPRLHGAHTAACTASGLPNCVILHVFAPFVFMIYPQSLSALGQNKKAGMTERPALPAPPPSCGLASVVPALRVGECSPDVERKQDRQRVPPKMGRLLPLTIIQSPDTPPCFTL